MESQVSTYANTHRHTHTYLRPADEEHLYARAVTRFTMWANDFYRSDTWSYCFYWLLTLNRPANTFTGLHGRKHYVFCLKIIPYNAHLKDLNSYLFHFGKNFGVANSRASQVINSPINTVSFKLLFLSWIKVNFSFAWANHVCGRSQPLLQPASMNSFKAKYSQVSISGFHATYSSQPWCVKAVSADCIPKITDPAEKRCGQQCDWGCN